MALRMSCHEGVWGVLDWHSVWDSFDWGGVAALSCVEMCQPRLT